MTARTVLGPHGYSRPPYGSFAGKPAVARGGATGPFSVLGPHGYSRPPYASFAGKTPQTSAKAAVGWVGRAVPSKRWWELLREEYQEQWDREHPVLAPSKAKKAVAARKVVEEIIEEARESNLLREENARQVAALSVAVASATKLTDTLKYQDQLQKLMKKLRDDEEEELMLVMSLIS